MSAPDVAVGEAMPLPADDIPAKFSLCRAFKRFVLCLLVALIAAGGWFGWQFYQDAAKLTGDTNPLQLASALLPTRPQETDGRINILVAGYSADDPGHAGAQLTDSIMILSVDPHTKSAYVLSVPRDLYVNIPGHGYSKINAAYEYGEADQFHETGYADGGMGLLEKTVAQDFGVQFGYQALINYTAFRDAVDAVGGVSVNIASPDPRGLYDPNANLSLPNGTVRLTGQQALGLARARGEGPGSYGFVHGDFDRTKHQQAVLLALKSKAGHGNLLLDPLRVLRLTNALGNNVKTDLKLGELETLYFDTSRIQNTNIQTISLDSIGGRNLLEGYTTRSGQSALIPVAGVDDYSQIRAALVQLSAGSVQ